MKSDNGKLTVFNTMTGIGVLLFILDCTKILFLATVLILSGYSLEKKNLDLKYINKKFEQIMFPCLITCAVIIISNLFKTVFIDGNTSIESVTKFIADNLICSFFLSNSTLKLGPIEVDNCISMIWLFPAFFFSIIMFKSMVQLSEEKKFLGITTGMISVLGAFLGRMINLPFGILPGCFFVFFIWIGFEFKRNNLLIQMKSIHYGIAFVIFLFAILVRHGSVLFGLFSKNDVIILFSLGISGFLLIYWFSKKLREQNIFSYIGENLVYILCVHIYALNFLDSFIWKITDVFSDSELVEKIVYLVIHLVIAVVGGMLVGYADAIKRQKKTQKIAKIHKKIDRNPEIDIAKGILIIVMIIGHCAIDSSLRKIIFSCHMMGFVFFSGYFYRKKSGKWVGTLCHAVQKFVVPYIIFSIFASIVFYVFNHASIIDSLWKYAVGMSYSKALFQSIPSVGPVYFILMLFLIRIIYDAIHKKITSEPIRGLVVFTLSVVGVLLGKFGFWLPWSLDIAIYSLIFYYIGMCFKKYHLLEWFAKNISSYFVLIIIWVYMIYSGSMEIADRDYGKYGVTILGAISGIILIYFLSCFIENTIPAVRSILNLCGKASLFILMMHTIFNGMVTDFVSQWFTPGYIFNMILSCAIQIMMGLCVYGIMQLKNKWCVLNKKNSL